MLQVGTVIDDKFEIVEKIGTGGFGSVYGAIQRQFDRKVAIKLLNTTVLLERDGVARFEREAKAISALKHKHIVSFYGFGIWKQTPYMVMELIDGVPLQEIIARDSRLEPARALRLIKQVLEALSCAHRVGIVHRDLKPSNILIAKEPDGSESVKIIDFGLAKLMPGYGIPGQKLTETGYALGTCHYMPPEQALGIPVDERADIYSAGCILYQMLAGKEPFVADDNVAIMYQHINDTPEPLAKRINESASVPVDAISALVNNCMAKDKNARYQSCEDAIRDIEAILQGKLANITQFSAQPMRTRRKANKKQQIKLLITCTVFAVCGLGALMFVSGLSHSPASSQLSTTENARRYLLPNAAYPGSMEDYAQLHDLWNEKPALTRLPISEQMRLCELLMDEHRQPFSELNADLEHRIVDAANWYQHIYEKNPSAQHPHLHHRYLNALVLKGVGTWRQKDFAMLPVGLQSRHLADACDFYFEMPFDSNARTNLDVCRRKLLAIQRTAPNETASEIIRGFYTWLDVPEGEAAMKQIAFSTSPFSQSAMSMLGTRYVANRELDKASEIAKELARLPGHSNVTQDLKLRIAFASEQDAEIQKVCASTCLGGFSPDVKARAHRFLAIIALKHQQLDKAKTEFELGRKEHMQSSSRSSASMDNFNARLSNDLLQAAIALADGNPKLQDEVFKTYPQVRTYRSNKWNDELNSEVELLREFE